MEFPEACILDTIKPYTGQDFDYAYVDAGSADLTDFQQYCFYSGPMWYHRRAFELAMHLKQEMRATKRSAMRTSNVSSKQVAPGLAKPSQTRTRLWEIS